MPNYKWRKAIHGLTPHQAPIKNVLPQKLATKWSVHQQMKQQDRLWASGRRVILQWGLFGAKQWAWPTAVDPNQTPLTDPTHPDTVTPYVVARAENVDITPGCHLDLWVWAIPSGETQVHDGSSGFDPGGAMGRVEVAVTWTNEDAATETRTYVLDLKGSDEALGNEPQGAGEAWWHAFRATRLCAPDGIHIDQALAAKWSTPGTEVDITVSHVGSPRIISGVLWERPRSIARDFTKSNWTFQGYGEDDQDYVSYPHQYPVQKASDVASGNPTEGMQHLIEVTQEVAKQHGPTLFYWSSYNDGGDGAAVPDPQDVYDTTSHGTNNPNATGDNEWPGITGTDSSFVNPFDTSITAFAETAAPSMSIGSGGYGRRYKWSGKPFLADKTGVVPVRVQARMKSGSGGTVTLRVMTAAHSYVDLTTTSTTWTTVEAWALLECGRNPEDGLPVQLLVKGGGGGDSWNLRMVRGQYFPELP